MRIKANWRVAAVLLIGLAIPPILVPPDVAASANDHSTERELVAAFVRLNFIWTGRSTIWRPWVRPPRWQFQHALTKERFWLKEGDTITVLFADLSSVTFRFIGTAIECPSGQCFEWVVGSEQGGASSAVVPEPVPLVFPDTSSRESPVAPFAAAGPNLPTMVRFAPTKYDPYDERNWAGPISANW